MHSQFDHLVIGIRELADGISEFERVTGVRAVRGGAHPGRGTENALVSLGSGQYLEIIAPLAGAELSPSDQPMRTLEKLTILTWAVSVSDLGAARERLAAIGINAGEPRAGARVTPSGAHLEWSVCSLERPEIATAPFFIQWRAESRHPSMTSPEGCTLAGLTVQDPAADDLARLLRAFGVTEVAVKSGPSRIEAALVCARGQVMLR